MALVAVVVVLAVVAVFGVAGLGRSVVDAGRARAAADAAALAGVTAGRAGSARLAAEHGAVVVSWSRRGAPGAATVTVTVRVGRARATAAASDQPGRRLPGGGRAPPPGPEVVPTLDS